VPPHPIVINTDGVLIDGRNRWAACQMASVEPRFDVLNGQDPVAYILSSNIARRHMNAGQRAMVTAKARLETKQTMRAVAATAGVSAARVSQSNTVIEYAPELANNEAAARADLESRLRHIRATGYDARGITSEFSTIQSHRGACSWTLNASMFS